MNREEVYSQCDELGLSDVLAHLESPGWNEQRKMYARGWVQLKQGEFSEDERKRLEEHHAQQITAQYDSAIGIVRQISASSIGVQEKMDKLSEKVNTLDARLDNLNKTIDNASKSSGFVGWALWGLTLIIAVVAVLELFIK